MFQSISFKITGATPLLMNCGRRANPLDPQVQELQRQSARRNKTDAEYAQIMRLEWAIALYLDRGCPCIPGEIFEAALKQAAKSIRLGKQIEAAVRCEENFPLEYPGPKDPENLWKDESFRNVSLVRLKSGRLLRCRPSFHDWSANVTVRYDDSLVNERQIVQCLSILGEKVGIMDWRPKYGRFIYEILNSEN